MGGPLKKFCGRHDKNRIRSDGMSSCADYIIVPTRHLTMPSAPPPPQKKRDLLRGKLFIRHRRGCGAEVHGSTGTTLFAHARACVCIYNIKVCAPTHNKDVCVRACVYTHTRVYIILCIYIIICLCVRCIRIDKRTGNIRVERASITTAVAPYVTVAIRRPYDTGGAETCRISASSGTQQRRR